MSNTFRAGTDWQGSSSPHIHRNVQADDLYPHLGQGPALKDALADGLHPVLAIGNDAAAEGRGHDQPVGIMAKYDSAIERAVMNVAHGFICHDQEVDNVLTYGGGVPNTWETSLQIGMKVYVDDSNDLALGVTLSLSPLNDAGLTNPWAGWLFYAQDEDEDVGVGGANADAWPKTAANEQTNVTVDVMLK